MQNSWQIINESSYAGDIYDINGRRMIVIVYNGNSYMARCKIENYYVNIEDFDKIFHDLQFEIMGQETETGPVFIDNIYEIFDSYELETIAEKMKETKN